MSRSSNIADAPARHGISLGEAVHQDGTLAHARHGSNTHMFNIVNEMTVHLVNCYGQVIIDSEPGDTFELNTWHNRPGWVIRVADQNHLRTRRNCSGDFFCAYS